MPQHDGSGPQGQGPGTGRGQGDCKTGFGCLGIFVIAGLTGILSAIVYKVT